MTLERRTSMPKLGGIIREKKDLFSFFFYVIIISIQYMVSYIGVELSFYLRLAALFILFLSLINNSKWLPFVLTLFWGTSLLSPLPLLPTETYYILLFTTVIWIFNTRRTIIKIEPRILIPVVYFIIMALITMEPILDYTSPLFLIIPIALLVSTFVNEEDDILRLLLALILMSLFLASLYLLRRNDFAETYKSFGIDRSSWTNSNMFGGCIGLGLVCAVGYCLNSFRLNKNRILNMLAITTIVVSIPALILNASRGALLAASMTSVLLLLVSKAKMSYKIIVTTLTIGFAIYLYNSGIFELIETRVGEENLETAGNRTLIWEAKFHAFSDYGVIPWTFGIGQPRLRYLGVFYSTHNDFVTAIIGYGVIGFILFLYFLYMPFKLAKNDKLRMMILTVIFLIEGMVLEPMFRGLLPFYLYYILLYKYSSLNRTTRLHL